MGTETVAVQIVEKITTAQIVEWFRQHGVPIGDETRPATIIGIARGYRSITTQYGESIGFRGTFELSFDDGQRYRAIKAYLPRAAEDLLREKIDAEMGGAAVGGARFLGVQFGWKLSRVADPKERTAYRWKTTPLIDIAQSGADDPLNAVRLLATGETREPEALTREEGEA